MNNTADKLWLKPFAESDFERLIAWISDESALMQFAGPVFAFPLTSDQLTSYLVDNKRQAFVVMCQQRPIGHAEIYRMSPGIVKLCRILIGEVSMRGKGLGQRLTLLLIRKSLADKEINRLILNVFDWNSAAIRCYSGAGFQVNSDFSAFRKAGNEEWKLIRMEISREEFQEYELNNS